MNKEGGNLRVDQAGKGGQNNGQALSEQLSENGAVLISEELQVDTLIVCGMMEFMSVDTVREAMDYGYQIKQVAYECTTMDLKLNGEVIPAGTMHKAFFAALDRVFAKIV